MDVDDLLSLEEAAEIIGRSPTTLRSAARRGSLEAKRIGRDWVTTHDAVIQYAVFHARGEVFGQVSRVRMASSAGTRKASYKAPVV